MDGHVDAERWKQVRAIFDSLVEHPPARQQAELAARCPDLALRAEVQDLLDADARAQSSSLLSDELAALSAGISRRLHLPRRGSG